MNDVSFDLAFIHYSNLKMIMFVHLTQLPSIFSSMHWIVVLVRLVHGFVLYTNIIHPWSGRIFLRFHSVLCFRRIYLRFIIRLSFLSRKAYERYILASKDFIRPCSLASCGSFWMNV